MHTDSFWHFPPLLNGTWSSGVLFECPDLQSYFDLWVITHHKLHLLLPLCVPLTFHLPQHTLTDFFCLRHKCCIFNTEFCIHWETCWTPVEHVTFHLLPSKCIAQLMKSDLFTKIRPLTSHQAVCVSIHLHFLQSKYTQQ